MGATVGLGEVVSLYRGNGESKEDGNKEREGEVFMIEQHDG